MTSDYLFSINQWRHKTKFLIVTLRKRVWVCMLLKTHTYGCFSRIETRRTDLLTPQYKAADVFHHSRGVSFTLLNNNNLLLALCEGFLFQNALADVYDGLSEPELRDRVPAYQVRVVIVSQRLTQVWLCNHLLLKKQVSSFSILLLPVSIFRYTPTWSRIKRALWSVYSEKKSADVV